MRNRQQGRQPQAGGDGGGWCGGCYLDYRADLADGGGSLLLRAEKGGGGYVG